jgi:hypothetical protein
VQNAQDKVSYDVIVEEECKTCLDYVNLDTKWRSTIVLHIIGIAVGALICLGLVVSMCCELSTATIWIMNKPNEQIGCGTTDATELSLVEKRCLL